MGKPVYLSVSKTIQAPALQVWETVAVGFDKVARYNPEIKKSRFDSEQKIGVGTRRHCDFPKTGYIKEEIIEWNDKISFKLQLIESSFPIAFMESKFSFVEAGDQTILKQEFWYKLKYPFGWASGFMRSKMRSTLESGLDGLDNYLTQFIH